MVKNIPIHYWVLFLKRGSQVHIQIWKLGVKTVKITFSENDVFNLNVVFSCQKPK